MYIEQVLENTIAYNTNLAIAQSAVKQEKVQYQNYNIQIPDLALSLAPLGFIFVWAIFLLLFQKIRSNTEDKVYLKSKVLQKVPCKKCQFFANNHYLKCAVKPDTVLTEDAINCSEYTPKKVSFPHKNLFR
jgi:DNA polymerase III gamma/tau subunit